MAAPKKSKKPPAKSKASAQAKSTPRRMPKPKVPPRLGPFVREGQLAWAVIAPLATSELEARIVAIRDKRVAFRFDDPDDEPEPRHWCVLAGKRGYAAMIDTHHGSASGESDYATALSKALGKTVYTASFGGYDDPDKGLPYIEQYVKGKAQLIWMAESYDDEYPTASLKTVAGPKGVPSTDPFDFASAFGFDLRPYYDGSLSPRAARRRGRGSA